MLYGCPYREVDASRACMDVRFPISHSGAVSQTRGTPLGEANVQVGLGMSVTEAGSPGTARRCGGGLTSSFLSLESPTGACRERDRDT